MTTTATCKLCKHYAPEPSYRIRMIHPRPDWGFCERADCFNGEAEDDKSLAVARDAEFYVAQLNVHETFGCIQFKAK
jgi:hypothetical protein